MCRVLSVNFHDNDIEIMVCMHKKLESEWNKCVEILNLFCHNIFSVLILKGKYHSNFLSFQNPKMFVCQVETKK